MESYDHERGILIMRTYNPRRAFIGLIITIVIEIIMICYRLSNYSKPSYIEGIWYDILIFGLPLAFLILFISLDIIGRYVGGVRYFENGILIPTGLKKRSFIKYSDIEYIMVPERGLKQFVFFSEHLPRIKVKEQTDYIDLGWISKKELAFLELKCNIKSFSGKYQLENDMVSS
jgi:hypothetical protein